MKNFIFLTVAVFSLLPTYSQSVISVQQGNSIKFETRLDSAVAHAQSGDTLYLPGGFVAGSGPINLTKKLSIIGVGYHIDSTATTSPTLSNITFQLSSGSEGSFITGIDFIIGNPTIISTSNITIMRCRLRYTLLFLANSILSNILIEENLLDGALSGGGGVGLINTFVKKNIIYEALNGLENANINFSNNIFFTAASLPTSSIFQNNVFLASGVISTGNSYCLKNLSVGTISNTGNNSGNLSNEPLANIFTNYTAGSSWNTSQNFHLKAGCRGIGLGTDGTDVGIYGTASPFKEGGLPFNPHYQKISIRNSTNSSGKLDINITVKAQDQ